MEIHPLTIPDKQPNQVGIIPLYIPAHLQYRERTQVEYLFQTPLHTLQGKSKSNSNDCQCRVHSTGTTSDRIRLRHIHIRNRQFETVR